jgi:ABC-type polysaccharide/polyol phosphate export permease
MGVSENKVLRRDGSLPFLSAPFKIIRNLYDNRQLLKHFIGRDLKVRYHNSILGYGWSVLEPLALTVTFYILFAILSDSEDPYRPLTILLGILAWSLFAKTFSNGTTCIQRSSSLIKRVYFPREIFIFSKSGFNMVQFLLSLLVIIPLLIHYDLMPSKQILLLPVALVMILILATGLAFFTSILQTKARDIEHMVTIGLRISFYLSPVFYPLEMITGGRIPSQYIGAYLIINPMATYITMIRSAFTGAPLDIPTTNLIITFTSTIAIFWMGAIYFMRKERKAVKFI